MSSETPLPPYYGENVLSLTVLWIAGFPALLLTGLIVWPLYALWPPLGSIWVVAPIFVVLFVPMLLVMCRTPRYCPACFKRVKIGAERCHHCTQRFEAA